MYLSRTTKLQREFVYRQNPCGVLNIVRSVENLGRGVGSVANDALGSVAKLKVPTGAIGAVGDALGLAANDLRDLVCPNGP